jgi:hypothetical protein
MTDNPFNFTERAKQRAAAASQAAEQQRQEADRLAHEARELHTAINQYYSPKYPAQVDLSFHQATVTLRKRGGGSTLTLEVLPNGKYKAVGGGGAGGFSPERVKQQTQELTKEQMMDQVDDWFKVATV